MSKIYFSIEEAEELLPFVKRKMKKLMDLDEQVEQMENIKIEIKDDSVENHLLVSGFYKQYHKLLCTFYKHFEDLINKGALVRDYKCGVVDFYSKFGDKDILLCWNVDEESILYWHEIEESFAQRKDIEILKKKYAEQLKRLV